MGAEGTAVVGQQIAQSIKASGAILRVEPDDFLRILARSVDPVISALGGYLSSGHDYLTSNKGIGLFTNSPKPLTLPEGVEVRSSARSGSLPSEAAIRRLPEREGKHGGRSALN